MSIKLEIISPEEVVLSKMVDMAVIPGLEGDIAAMEGHSPMILLLRGGLISLYEGEKVTDSYFVESGFAEIKESQCTVLVDHAMKPDAIDEKQASERLNKLQIEYDSIAASKDADLQRDLIDQIQAARVMLDLSTTQSK